MMRHLIKTLLTLLLILVPVSLLAADAMQGQGRGPSLDSLLFSTKYGLTLLFVIVGTVLMWVGQMKHQLRIALMLLAFLIFGGILISVHPSPVCATTKPFIQGMRNPFLVMLVFVGAVTLLFNKSYCGTACPGGALQEFIYWLPFVKKGNRKEKVPFRISNAVRIGVTALFFIFVLTAGISIFEYINFFELFHWTIPGNALLLLTLTVVIVLVLVVSAFYYRPFCYFLCPMGLATWILEQFSLSRVRLDREKCTDCGICVHASPCPAVEGILEEKMIRADCHLCGECIESCPEDALDFGIRGR